MSRFVTKKSSRTKFDLESLLLSDASDDSNKENDGPTNANTYKRVTKKRKVAKKETFSNEAKDEDKTNFGDEEDFVDMSKILENFGSDLNKSLRAKKTRLEEFTHSIAEFCEKKTTELNKEQEAEIDKIKEQFTVAVNSELEKWEEEMTQIKLQEEKVQKLLQQQMKAMQNAVTIQGQRLKTLAKVHKSFIQQFNDLKMKHGQETLALKHTLKQEMVQLQKQFLLEVRKEEMAAVRKSIGSVIF